MLLSGHSEYQATPHQPNRDREPATANAVGESTEQGGYPMRTGDLERHNERPTVANDRRRVRVWFGSHVIADVTEPAAKAAQTEEGWRRRFEGLRVTNDAAEPDSLVAAYSGHG